MAPYRSMTAAACILTACLGLAACDTRSDEAAAPQAASASTDKLRLEPGLWTQTRQPGGTSEPRCITDKEALSANGTDAEIRSALDAQARAEGCTIASLQIDGPVIAFSQVCGATQIAVTTTYHGDRSSTQMTGPGMPPITSEGRRLGEC